MIINIPIPEDVKYLIQTGQTVNFDTQLIEIKERVDIAIHISQKLNIPSDKIFMYLKKFVGDDVNKGDILAEKKGFMTKQAVISEDEGIIKEVNHDSGEIVISATKGRENQIKAFFKGEVLDLKKNSLKLKVHDGHAFTLKQASADFGGELHYLGDDSDLVSQEIAEKVLLAENINPYIKVKTEALGIRGYISFQAPPDTQLPYCQIKNIEDQKKIFKLGYPYCYIDKSSGKIYFYK